MVKLISRICWGNWRRSPVSLRVLPTREFSGTTLRPRAWPLASTRRSITFQRCLPTIRQFSNTSVRICGGRCRTRGWWHRVTASTASARATAARTAQVSAPRSSCPSTYSAQPLRVPALTMAACCTITTRLRSMLRKYRVASSNCSSWRASWKLSVNDFMTNAKTLSEPGRALRVHCEAAGCGAKESPSLLLDHHA